MGKPQQVRFLKLSVNQPDCSINKTSRMLVELQKQVKQSKTIESAISAAVKCGYSQCEG